MSWSEDALVVMMEASHGSPITLRENDAEKGLRSLRRLY